MELNENNSSSQSLSNANSLTTNSSTASIASSSSTKQLSEEEIDNILEEFTEELNIDQSQITDIYAVKSPSPLLPADMNQSQDNESSSLELTADKLINDLLSTEEKENENAEMQVESAKKKMKISDRNQRDEEDVDVDHEQMNEAEDESDEENDSQVSETDFPEPHENEELYQLIEIVNSQGVEAFIQSCKYSNDETKSPSSILKLFGLETSAVFQSQPIDRQWHHIQSFLISNVYERQRIESLCSIQDAVELIKRSERILIVTGAGISVSCGIPDFRSANGIYARLKDKYDLPAPEMMFDLEYFKIDPNPFFDFAKDLFPGNFTPSLSHFFIKSLEEKGKLLRNYTQNIDTLEQVAGITNVVQCHGSFATASCMTCKFQMTSEEIKEDIMAQKIPYCPKCQTLLDQEKLSTAKKSSSSKMTEVDDEDDDNQSRPVTFGILKPDIVFFGENLPQYFYDLLEQDILKCDLIIVMGSSLKVQPVAGIKDILPPNIPQILINKENLRHTEFDIELIGDCDNIISTLCKMLEWDLSGTSTLMTEMSDAFKFVEPNITLFPEGILKGHAKEYLEGIVADTETSEDGEGGEEEEMTSDDEEEMPFSHIDGDDIEIAGSAEDVDDPEALYHPVGSSQEEVNVTDNDKDAVIESDQLIVHKPEKTEDLLDIQPAFTVTGSSTPLADASRGNDDGSTDACLTDFDDKQLDELLNL